MKNKYKIKKEMAGFKKGTVIYINTSRKDEVIFLSDYDKKRNVFLSVTPDYIKNNPDLFE